MLFFLTGDIQIGKTRWLQGVIDELASRGVVTYGVIAPGRWVETPNGFQKMGIDNVMLPQGERVSFADPAQRGWCFHDDAIERVDRHFAELMSMRGSYCEAGGDPADDKIGSQDQAPHGVGGETNTCDGQSRFLVVDELGWMELERCAGLVSAVALLDAGASSVFPHALVVVRETLLPLANKRFASADWGGFTVLRPNEESRAALVDCLTA